MKIIVTGGNGQLGRDLVRVLQEKHEVVGFGKDQWDVTDLNQCEEIILAHKPDMVIHAAAYTSVDLAESEVDRAFAINANGTRNVAIAAEKAGVKLCYISTDYVFDGTKGSSYTEFDLTNPTSVYGKSKLAGEAYITDLLTKYFIVRTSWVYGLYGNNFVKTMIGLADGRDQVKVVSDQFGSPTYTIDLCRFLLELLTTEHYGIYHASNSGACSWYEYAQAIFEETGLSIKVEPCTTQDFARPAPRPPYSVLDHAVLRSNGFTDLQPWQDALKQFLKELI
ncbi:MAG: NAD(P)-dependent oxidoreductase [Bacilli bacterium]|nr:NAD(P)-dependent oxidoreductase [Bacilli bacterium]